MATVFDSVKAAEREAVLKIAGECGFPFNKYGLLQGDDDGEINADVMLVEFAQRISAMEREACAVVCDEADATGNPGWSAGTKACAREIRERANLLPVVL